MESSIEGVKVTRLREIKDSRGSILHMIRKDSPDFTGFGECYFSEVLPGAVKAWKRHQKQSQYWAVPVGRLRVVLFDDRAGSRSHGKIEVLELGRPDHYVGLKIPPGIWYGFSSIGPSTSLIVNCADLMHDPSEGETKAVNDPQIPYRWDNLAEMNGG
jgi:dTDP-4-dehydrorhamnose 3,5-epimerase